MTNRKMYIIWATIGCLLWMWLFGFSFLIVFIYAGLVYGIGQIPVKPWERGNTTSIRGWFRPNYEDSDIVVYIGSKEKPWVFFLHPRNVMVRTLFGREDWSKVLWDGFHIVIPFFHRIQPIYVPKFDPDPKDTTRVKVSYVHSNMLALTQRPANTDFQDAVTADNVPVRVDCLTVYRIGLGKESKKYTTEEKQYVNEVVLFIYFGQERQAAGLHHLVIEQTFSAATSVIGDHNQNQLKGGFPPVSEAKLLADLLQGKTPLEQAEIRMNWQEKIQKRKYKSSHFSSQIHQKLEGYEELEYVEIISSEIQQIKYDAEIEAAFKRSFLGTIEAQNQEKAMSADVKFFNEMKVLGYDKQLASSIWMHMRTLQGQKDVASNAATIILNTGNNGQNTGGAIPTIPVTQAVQ